MRHNIIWIMIIAIMFPIVLAIMHNRKREYERLLAMSSGCWTEEDINNMGWEDDGAGGVKRI